MNATLERHPLSAAFPDMPGDELQALADDIRRNGQQEPGLLLDGQVLDGWHRHQACQLAGVPFNAIEFTGADPVSYVVAKNVHRRHLTASQRAEAQVRCAAWRAPGQSAPGAVPTTAQMAEAAKVSPRLIEYAKQAHRAGLGDAVRDGVLSAKQAAGVAKLPEEERERAIQEPPKPEKPAVTQIPTAELEAMRRRIAELEEQLQAANEDNASMVRIFEANDQIAAATKEAHGLRGQTRILQGRINQLLQEKNDAARRAAHWERKAKGQ